MMIKYYRMPEYVDRLNRTCIKRHMCYMVAMG